MNILRALRLISRNVKLAKPITVTKATSTLSKATSTVTKATAPFWGIKLIPKLKVVLKN